jgi:hypothetical protein
MYPRVMDYLHKHYTETALPPGDEYYPMIPDERLRFILHKTVESRLLYKKVEPVHRPSGQPAPTSKSPSPSPPPLSSNEERTEPRRYAKPRARVRKRRKNTSTVSIPPSQELLPDLTLSSMKKLIQSTKPTSRSLCAICKDLPFDDRCIRYLMCDEYSGLSSLENSIITYAVSDEVLLPKASTVHLFLVLHNAMVHIEIGSCEGRVSRLPQV